MKVNRREFLQGTGAGATAALAGCTSLLSQEEYSLHQEQSKLHKCLYDFMVYLDTYYRETVPINNNTYPIQLSIEIEQSLRGYDFKELKKMRYAQVLVLSSLCDLLKNDLEKYKKTDRSEQQGQDLENNLKVNSNTFLRTLYLPNTFR